MTDETRAALTDLLAVTALGDVTIARVQRWQQAARQLLHPPAPVAVRDTMRLVHATREAEGPPRGTP